MKQRERERTSRFKAKRLLSPGVALLRPSVACNIFLRKSYDYQLTGYYKGKARRPCVETSLATQSSVNQPIWPECQFSSISPCQ